MCIECDQHSSVKSAVEAACPGRIYAYPGGLGLTGLTQRLLNLYPNKFVSDGVTITLGMSRLSFLHSDRFAPHVYLKTSRVVSEDLSLHQCNMRDTSLEVSWLREGIRLADERDASA